MALTPKELLNQLLQTEGAMCAALVDSTSGMVLESVGTGVDMELAAAGNTEVVRSKMKTMKSLGLEGAIEDILITLTHQYHIIRPVAKHNGLLRRRQRSDALRGGARRRLSPAQPCSALFSLVQC